MISARNHRYGCAEQASAADRASRGGRLARRSAGEKRARVNCPPSVRIFDLGHRLSPHPHIRMVANRCGRVA